MQPVCGSGSMLHDMQFDGPVECGLSFPRGKFNFRDRRIPFRSRTKARRVPKILSFEATGPEDRFKKSAF